MLIRHDGAAVLRPQWIRSTVPWRWCGGMAWRVGLPGGVGLLVACGLALAAHAAGRFDGTYAGSAVPVSGMGDPACAAFHATITVVNDHLTYSHHLHEGTSNVHGGHFVAIAVDVVPDGSFTGMVESNSERARGTGSVKGMVSGDTMDVNEAFSDCAFHIALKKRQ